MEFKKFAYILILGLLFTSCELLLGKDDELSIKREDYNGHALRLDGYYYTGDSLKSILFLYKNGVILSAGSVQNKEWDKYERRFLDDDFRKKVSNMKFGWGLFKINDDKLIYERWYPSQKPYHTAIKECEILNDTTFIVLKSISADGETIFRRNNNAVYHFKKFKHKLDSVTKFID